MKIMKKNQLVSLFLFLSYIFNWFAFFKVPPIDPLSPKPEGGISVPSCGEQLIVSSQWPKTFIAALQQHAIQQPRTNAITILDEQTKPAQTLTFRKCFEYFAK